MSSDNTYDISQFYRLTGFEPSYSVTPDLPWDQESGSLSEATSYESMRDAQKAAIKAGFIDTDKKEFDSAKTIASSLGAIFRMSPDSKKFFIKDRRGVLTNPKDLERLVDDALSSYFYQDTNDYEIYADGPDGFEDPWGYELHKVWTGTFNKLKNKATVKAVMGKTAKGWEVTIAKSYSDFAKDAMAEVVKAAEQRAKNSVFPESEKAGQYVTEIPGLEAVRAKFYAMGQK
jgi:hypothetical protein